MIRWSLGFLLYTLCESVMASKYLLSEDSSIPKWKIALAFGGVVVIGAGVYYKFFKTSQSSEPKKSTGKISKPTEKTKSAEKNTVSNGSPNLDTTPLGRARQLKTEGNGHFRSTNYDEAIKCYDEAIKLCPADSSHDLSTFFQNRAAAYEHKADWASVMRDCTSALELNPRYTKALQRRARAAETLLDYELALEDYTAICIIESFSNPESLGVVDRLLKQIGLAHAEELFSKPRDHLPSVHSIRSYLGGFCCDPVYNSVHSEKEGDADANEDIPEKNSVAKGFVMAKQLLRDEQYEGILDCCDRELANPLSPHIGETKLLRGTMLVLLNHKQRAMEDFSNVANDESLPIDLRVAALVKMGALHMANNESEKSLATYARALTLDENNPDIYHQRGQTRLIMNQIQEAIEDFQKVTELKPDFAIGHVQKLHTDYRFASFKGEKSRAAEVIKEFQKAMKKFPKCTEVYLLLTQILVDEEKFEEADKLFKDLASVDSSNPTQLVYQGMLLVQWKSDIAGAVALIKKALEMDKQCEMALENLATISVQTGRLEEGVRLFNLAIPLAKSITEMSHYCSLRDAAVAQIKVVRRLGISLPESPDL